MASNNDDDIDDISSLLSSSLPDVEDELDQECGEDDGAEEEEDEEEEEEEVVDCETVCSICNEKYFQPRVLSCLHVFCEQCLNKLLLEREDEREEGIAPSPFITCPECRQETKVSKHGASSLPPDYVYCAIKDASNIADQEIACTSCKTKKNAVARCNDCTNFLCPSCVTAHQYMRCFENHKVVPFRDMAGNSDVNLLKPISCPTHSNETLKYFCHTCQFPICDDCVVTEHKLSEHEFDSISDVEQKQRDELQNLMTESKSKVQFCEDASSTLENLLSELQMQNDNAKSHIEETFQTYKAFLEKVKDQKLKELDDMHTTQELRVMDTFQSVEKTVDKIEDACKFTTRLLNNGNITEILLLKSVVGSQLLYLINNTPKPDVSVCLEFKTDESKFEEAVMSSFGDFKRVESTAKDSIPPSSLHSSFESEAFVLPAGVLGPNDVNSARPNMDLTTPTFPDFTFSQLASIAADMSQSPTSPLDFSDIMASNSLVSSNINTLNNLTALAKLGSVSLNNQGHLLMNGQVPGYGMDGSIQTRPPNSTSPPNSLQTPLSSTFEAASALGTLLNGGLPSPHEMSSGGDSPHLDGNMLLNSSSAHLNGTLSSVLANSLLGGGNDLMNFTAQGFSSRCNSNAKLNPVRIRFKFGQLGPGKGQFSSPHGFCLGVEEEIVVADTNNHRIQVFDKAGDFKYQFGIPGKEEGQLWYPRKVAVMRNSGKFVVCDRGNERSRMQIFTKNGHFIKKIAIRYIDIVAGLAITNQGHIVAVDSVSPTVFVISEGGDLLRWFDCSDYMREPSDIAISGKEYFVCDFKGHCVVVFNDEGQFLRRIGCENITNYPNGIDIGDAGDVLVGDSHGNRFHVAVFSRDGSLLSEFECPYVKVSRCCGLKITTEGYVVTLAKNNHHVLILNTLYIM